MVVGIVIAAVSLAVIVFFMDLLRIHVIKVEVEAALFCKVTSRFLASSTCTALCYCAAAYWYYWAIIPVTMIRKAELLIFASLISEP